MFNYRHPGLRREEPRVLTASCAPLPEDPLSNSGRLPNRIKHDDFGTFSRKHNDFGTFSRKIKWGPESDQLLGGAPGHSKAFLVNIFGQEPSKTF